MRLIDADELLNSTIYNPLHAPYITKQDVINAPTIKATVDAVPVVRCKECVFWLRDEGHGSNGECECGCNDGWWLPEDYCSCGERRDKDETD